MSIESSQFVFPIQGAATLRELNLMREEGLLTDVTIVTDDREFECHRAVLAASCPYFKAMFSYGLRECFEKSITLHGVMATIMENILKYAYTGMCVLNKSNAPGVLAASDLFGLIPLRNAAAEYLQKSIDVSNCLQIKKLADEHSCFDLHEAANQFAQNHFTDVIHQDEFLQLTFQGLMSYLQDDDLKVHREDLVYEAAMQWIRYDMTGRKQHVAEILESVRLPFVHPEYLKLQISVEPLIYENKACNIQILKEENCLKSEELTNPFLEKQMKPRKCASQEVVMVLGGETRISSLVYDSKDITYFDSISSSWLNLSTLPIKFNIKAFSAVSIGYEMYITGGTRNNVALNEVSVFCTYLNKWSDSAPMLKARYHHACTSVNESVFAVGGTDGVKCLNDVETYEPKTKSWISIRSMPHAVKSAAVAGYKNKLYVFGGFSDQYVMCKIIQQYSMETKDWTVYSSSAIDYACAQAAVVDAKVYLLGGSSKTVKVFDPETNVVKKAPDMLQKRSNCGAASVGKMLYVSGGLEESSGSSLGSVECFCPVKNQWKFVPDMTQKRHRHTSVCIRVPKQHIETSKQHHFQKP